MRKEEMLYEYIRRIAVNCICSITDRCDPDIYA
nr:MAG TPA: hypothetical protein [Bacteriophage sp.]